jgi:transcriptional regulator with XRE-family HTH domain
MDAGNTTDADSRGQVGGRALDAGELRLKELRQGRGWSQRDEALLLKQSAGRFGFHHIAGTKTRSVVREIQRWEAGEHAPDERYQLLLAHAYATRDGSATIEPGSDLDRLIAALAAMGVPLDRRTFLQATAIAAATAGSGAFLSLLTPELQERTAQALAHPDRVDLETVQRLRQAVGELQQQSEGAMPYHRLASALGPHVEVAKRLLLGMQPDPIRQELVTVGVLAFNLAGRVAFNLRDYASAKQYGDDAEEVAKELNDGWMRRWWLARRARLARFDYQDVDEALSYATLSCRNPDSSSGLVLFWTHCVLAEMTSLQGDERSARKALDLARFHADGVSTEDPASFLFPEARFGGIHAKIGAYEGTCYLREGSLEEAEGALWNVVDTVPDGIPGQKAFSLADLALVYVRQRELERACATLMDAISMTERSGGKPPRQRIYLVRRELHPWRDESFVRAVDDRLYATAQLL